MLKLKNWGEIIFTNLPTFGIIMLLFEEASSNSNYVAFNIIKEELILKDVEGTCHGVVDDVESRKFRGMTERSLEDSQYGCCPFSIQNYHFSK
jgi:hypothetical protein